MTINFAQHIEKLTINQLYVLQTHFQFYLYKDQHKIFLKVLLINI